MNERTDETHYACSGFGFVYRAAKCYADCALQYQGEGETISGTE